MANPTTLAGKRFATLEASDQDATINLDSDCAHLLKHTGLESDGTTESTDVVYLGDGVEPDSDLAGAADKLSLASGDTIVIPPGIQILHYKTADGSPVISIVEIRRFFGRY